MDALFLLYALTRGSKGVLKELILVGQVQSTSCIKFKPAKFLCLYNLNFRYMLP